MEDFVRWYSPRDWIACDETLALHDHSSTSHDHSSGSHDQLCSEDVSIVTTTGDDVTISDDVSLTDTVTNNNTTDVTKNSDVSGWDEDWAEIEEEPSNATSVTNRVTMVTACV